MAAEIDLTYGQLKIYSALDGAGQVIALKNNGPAFRSAEIECGFFQGDRLLATASAFAENVEAGQTAYVEAIASQASKADQVNCRTVGVRK